MLTIFNMPNINSSFRVYKKKVFIKIKLEKSLLAITAKFLALHFGSIAFGVILSFVIFDILCRNWTKKMQ